MSASWNSGSADQPPAPTRRLHQYGEDSIRFFTRIKVVTQRWPHSVPASDQSVVQPKMR
jgi:hypothetical protein